jgi:hypothetical protein
MMVKSLILAATGLLLIGICVAVPVEHPLIGYLVGSVLVLVGACPLIRRWPKKSEADEHERGGI